MECYPLVFIFLPNHFFAHFLLVSQALRFSSRVLWLEKSTRSLLSSQSARSSRRITFRSGFDEPYGIIGR